MVEDAACLEEGKGHGDGDVPAADSQWEKLLGNGRVPVPLPATATIPVQTENRRRSSVGSILSSFRRSFRFTTGGTKGAGGEGGAFTGHVFSRYRQSRFNARRIRKRVVFKHGDCNVVQGNVAKRSTRYMQDIFTTLVDAQWRWTLFVFSMNFLLSWLAFAIVWWFISFTHGDLVPQNFSNSSWTPCVTNIRDFSSCFLFSVETQHTIGYGNRTPTEACPEAIFFLCLQSITGVMIQAFMVGIVFAKLSRPKKRTQTLLFSRHAVICQRDGTLCLMFRVGDMRKSHIIEAHVRAQLIRHKVTKEGESLPFYQTELKVGGDGEEDKIFFIWPTTIVHKIDKNSPLYQLSATDLLRERFEIVVILEGVIESTGMTTQARSSYLPSEILWGHRFQTLVSFKSLNGEYEVDYALFNNTVEVDTPLSSAKQLDEFGIVEQQMSYDFSSRSPSSNTLCSMDSMSIDLSLADGGLHLHQHHLHNYNNHLHQQQQQNHFHIGNLHCSSSANTDSTASVPLSTAVLLSRNGGSSSVGLSFGRRMSAPHNHTTVAV